MSETYATALTEVSPIALEIAPKAMALPQSSAELHALIAAERAAERAAVSAEITAQINAQVDAKIKAGIAAGVAEEVQRIIEQWRLARRKQFGPSSEAHQLGLFNEAELEFDAANDTDVAQDEDATAAAPGIKPKRGHRRALPAHLPRVEVVVDVPEEERQCKCGSTLVRIGEDVSEQLDIIPMQVRVIRTVRPRYACPKGDQAPVQQPAPARVLERSNFSAGFLAMLAVTKYADGLPLARFEKVLARHNAEVPRQSLARAIIGLSKALQPLHNLMRDHLLDSAVIHMDETPIQVLKEPERSPSSKSYMWVQSGGPPGKRITLFDYDPSRSGQVPIRLLEGWSGFLMTDCYEGYAPVARNPGIEHLACMAHARRKFVEAKHANPKGKSARADHVIGIIAQLYRVEAQVRDSTEAERLQARQTISLPILQKLRAWLDENLLTALPKSKLGQALGYLHNHWHRFVRYTERGDLPIDNNLVENAIRPFVIGRKGWLFADTPAGAHASAVIYSLIETAKTNGREPYAWLFYVLGRVAQAQTVDEIEALLPWNVHDQDLAMNLETWK